jgi:hypothetical protein
MWGDRRARNHPADSTGYGKARDKIQRAVDCERAQGPEKGSNEGVKLMHIRTTIAAVALLSVAAGAASAASVTKSIDVNAPPAKVWAMIGPFCSISAWHPAIGKCTSDEGQPAPTRTLVTKDGKGAFIELQTARDDNGMSYSYAIKSSPLPVSGYTSTIKVTPKGKDMSTVTWSGAFTPASGKEADAENAVSGIYQSGLDAVKAKAGM